MRRTDGDKNFRPRLRPSFFLALTYLRNPMYLLCTTLGFMCVRASARMTEQKTKRGLETYHFQNFAHVPSLETLPQKRSKKFPKTYFLATTTTYAHSAQAYM